MLLGFMATQDHVRLIFLEQIQVILTRTVYRSDLPLPQKHLHLSNKIKRHGVNLQKDRKETEMATMLNVLTIK